MGGQTGAGSGDEAQAAGADDGQTGARDSKAARKTGVDKENGAHAAPSHDAPTAAGAATQDRAAYSTEANSTACTKKQLANCS